ncbi:aminotransferase class V-fold PLP-dependent enzyme [Candidatus Peregrinibacteria bacterium]|nr:aminotransferase class V-fold PLP-dependent enzyme [Candidatus Peregrinibacteria bacterium]
MDPRVYEAMKPYCMEEFGNPSAICQRGQHAKNALEQARLTVSTLLDAKPEEIIFTSGGTESDNLALLGVARAYKNKGKHIITSTIEHHAVLHTAQHLEKEGFEVTYIPVESNGIVDAAKVKEAMRDDTILVSIMYANNEIGTIQPIAKIGRACKKRGIPFHTDACQATGALQLSVDRLHVDLMTINGSKMYGPKGVGVLYVRSTVNIDPIMYGGQQEKGMRPGTENVAGIIGLAKALEIAEKEREKESARLTELRDYMITELEQRIPKTELNGDPVNRLPNNVNISILEIEGEALLLRLDMKGINASSGSACTSGSLDPSHVILALGKTHLVAHGSIRFSLGKSTTKKDIDYVLNVLPEIVKDLRAISPLSV